MSILYCPRCDDDYDSDLHTEPLCKHCMAQITTENVSPPIPDRQFDWQAVFADTYDGAEDAGREFRMIGTGPTEKAAIDDLISKLEAV
jgi:hypothetical protein